MKYSGGRGGGRVANASARRRKSSRGVKSRTIDGFCFDQANLFPRHVAMRKVEDFCRLSNQSHIVSGTVCEFNCFLFNEGNCFAVFCQGNIFVMKYDSLTQYYLLTT